MTATNSVRQSVETELEGYIETSLPPLQHKWPLLGKELFALEHTLTDPPAANERVLSEHEQRKKQITVRDAVIDYMYRDEEPYDRGTRYLAFLLLKAGRGGAVVGNPFAVEKSGKRQNLPFTGLEGYFAGSEMTPERPGMTPQAILLEEAGIGSHLLNSIKRHAIEQNTWGTFSRLKRVLAGAEPDVKELRLIQILWSIVVRQLHVRIYHNGEFELTITERIEQLERLLSSVSGRRAKEKRLREDVQAERSQLKRAFENLSAAEKEREKQVRKTRERVREDRLAAFRRFRDETYQMLTEPGQSRYTVGVDDSTLKQATIVETMTLPRIPGRETYPPTPLHFTRDQLDGYLFLSRLGEIGGDPLVRSVLVSR